MAGNVVQFIIDLPFVQKKTTVSCDNKCSIRSARALVRGAALLTEKKVIV